MLIETLQVAIENERNELRVFCRGPFPTLTLASFDSHNKTLI